MLGVVADKKAKSRSKSEKSECPYCHQHIVLQNLKRHISDKHPGKVYKRKGENTLEELFSNVKKNKVSDSNVKCDVTPNIAHHSNVQTHLTKDEKQEVDPKEVFFPITDI